MTDIANLEKKIKSGKRWTNFFGWLGMSLLLASPAIFIAAIWFDGEPAEEWFLTGVICLFTGACLFGFAVMIGGSVEDDQKELERLRG